MYIKSLTKIKKSLQLFCFPYAGGSAAIYFPWKESIGKEVELLAIQLPGRGELFSEKAIEEMDTLVEKLYIEISPYLKQPFAFFGHSMGGVIAYALLKKIEKESSVRAEFIVISASKPPFKYYEGNEYLLDDEALKEKLISHNATPKEILESNELMELVLPIYRSDLALINKYNPSAIPKLQSKVHLFNTLKDMTKEEILQWYNYFETKGEYYEFEGGHFFINTHRDLVINILSTLLRTAYER